MCRTRERPIRLRQSRARHPRARGRGGGLINISFASVWELEALSGIGEVTAQRISEYREANGLFETIEDIQNVSGIGPKAFVGIKEMIFVRP